MVGYVPDGARLPRAYCLPRQNQSWPEFQLAWSTDGPGSAATGIGTEIKSLGQSP